MAALRLQNLETQNISISAYRVLYILLTLVQYRSLNMLELNRFLYENPLIQRVYNAETLTKYINTLREVGCEIPRSSSRTDYCYELRKHPFPIQLEPEEIQVAEKLLHLLAHSPDEALYEGYRDFLDGLTWAVETEQVSEEVQNKKSRQKVLNLFPDLAARQRLLSTYRHYCEEAFTLQVKYRRENQASEDIVLEPHEVLERGKSILLLGMGVHSQEHITLDIGNIENTRQLPSKNKRPLTQTTVVFALFHRLAKSYRLYPEEKIIYQNAQELHIKTKVGDPEDLLNRLMKYGASCEIISPCHLRATIRERISNLLCSLDSTSTE